MRDPNTPPPTFDPHTPLPEPTLTRTYKESIWQKWMPQRQKIQWRDIYHFHTRLGDVRVNPEFGYNWYIDQQGQTVYDPPIYPAKLHQYNMTYRILTHVNLFTYRVKIAPIVTNEAVLSRAQTEQTIHTTLEWNAPKWSLKIKWDIIRKCDANTLQFYTHYGKGTAIHATFQFPYQTSPDSRFQIVFGRPPGMYLRYKNPYGFDKELTDPAIICSQFQKCCAWAVSQDIRRVADQLSYEYRNT